jgi:hypothetical protein
MVDVAGSNLSGMITRHRQIYEVVRIGMSTYTLATLLGLDAKDKYVRSGLTRSLKFLKFQIAVKNEGVMENRYDAEVETIITGFPSSRSLPNYLKDIVVSRDTDTMSKDEDAAEVSNIKEEKILPIEPAAIDTNRVAASSHDRWMLGLKQELRQEASEKELETLLVDLLDEKEQLIRQIETLHSENKTNVELLRRAVEKSKIQSERISDLVKENEDLKKLNKSNNITISSEKLYKEVLSRRANRLDKKFMGVLG